MSTSAKAVPVHSIAEESDRSIGREPYSAEILSVNHRWALYRYAAFFAKAKIAVDIGCGTGFGTELLAQYGAQAYGLDECVEALEYAAARPLAKSEFLHSSESALPFASDSVDLVTAFEVIQSSSDWSRLVPEAARVLKAGGVFIAALATEDSADLGLEPENWHKLLADSFPFVVLISQRPSDSSLLVGAPLPGCRPFVVVSSRRPVELPWSGLVSPALLHPWDREFQIQSLKEELHEVRSFNFALRHRHTQLNDDVAAHHRWADCLDSALGVTQATLRIRQRQLELLKIELTSKQQEIDELKRQQTRIRTSSWVRLGRVLGFGPFGDRISLHLLVLRLTRALTDTARVFASSLEAIKTAVTHLALYCLSPILLCLSLFTIALVDLCFAIFGTKKTVLETAPRHDSASVIIPNWNGRGLLKDFLPSVLTALAANAGNEIIVVDNASTDGSAVLLKTEFPQVRVVQLSTNQGFGGACNLGVAAASNEVVVLLNNDMRVAPDFLPTLLEKFADPKVFAVASQIFFSDSTRRREETGLTQTWWQNGHVAVTHHVDPAIKDVFPCAYPGGGSSAFDKRKFLELGGFDELFRPFYYEDTDLGRLAWKRGWKVLYDPASVVYHNHRGTIGRKFRPDYIEEVIRRNSLLYCWKDIHDWRLLSAHFTACIGNSLQSVFRKKDDLWCLPIDSLHTFWQLKRVITSRWLSNSLRTISDKEAFHRPLGGYYRDRFLSHPTKTTDRLNVLFVSPYPIEPPVHGGAVFMKQAIQGLTTQTNLHLISFVDNRRQLGPQEKLRALCKSVKFIVRPNVVLDNQWSLTPNGVREFKSRELSWAIHRAIYRQAIDVVQLDYTVLGQYAGEFKHIPCLLFEHDISMQSLFRQIRAGGLQWNLLLEYGRMRIYEPRMLKRFARIQVCSRENADHLRKVVPRLKGRIDADLRAGIDIGRYPYVEEGREPGTLLFIGSFRHQPNVAALSWFTNYVFPQILAQNPETILLVVGSNPPAGSTVWNEHPNVRLLGTVPDVRVALQRYGVFVCPVLSGSGVRVKLLEAFASGIPCVSTKVGAEGLSHESEEICMLADSASYFTSAVLRLLNDRQHGAELARRARQMVEREWDSQVKAGRLEQVYRNEVNRTRNNYVSTSNELR